MNKPLDMPVTDLSGRHLAATHLDPLFENIPDSLKKYPAWVLWRYEPDEKKEKPKKVLINPHTGERGSSTDFSKTADFDTVKSEYLAHKDRYAGVGIVLGQPIAQDCYIAGLDLDESQDAYFMQFLEAGYMEKSPSGAGLRGITLSKSLFTGINKVISGHPDSRLNGLRVEMYSKGRYMTITGHTVFNYNSLYVSKNLPDLIKHIREQKKELPQQIDVPPKTDIDGDFWADEYDRALFAVGTQAEGGRNTVLHEQAVHVFSLIKEHRIKKTIDQAKADLHAAALRNGLSSEEINGTLDSALKSRTVSIASPERHKQSVSEWKKQKALEKGIQWKDLSDNGRPLNTIENLKALLNFYQIVGRYNVIKKKQEIIIPNMQFFADTQDNDVLSEIVSRSNRERFPTTNTDKFLSVICSENLYNPVLTWINSKPWDGVNRLPEFLKTVQVSSPKKLKTGDLFHEYLIRKWMIQAIAAASANDGFSAVGVLVFQGDQGLGKTRWFKHLVPEEYRTDLLKSESSLNPQDKDSVLQNIGYWLVELGELDGTFKKAEINALKAFITNSVDEIRRPYSSKPNTYGRRTTFFASVNSEHFLVDETGNRRFWTIPTVRINHDHDFDMQQVWAEVYALFTSGESYLLNQEAKDILHETNSEHTVRDPIADFLETELDWACTDKRKWISETPTNLFIKLTGRQPKNRVELTTLSTLLRMKGISTRKSNGARVYDVPPLKNTFGFEAING